MIGAIELVQHFHRNGIPIAIATGSHQHAYDVKMSTKPELVRCLSHAICSDNPLVKNGKPSPDIYLITASKFISPPETMDKVCLSVCVYTIHMYVCMNVCMYV